MSDLNVNVSAEVLNRAKKIKLVIFDVDGVMTDGGLTIGDDGQDIAQLPLLIGLRGYKIIHGVIGVMPITTIQLRALLLNGLANPKRKQCQHNRQHNRKK